MTLKTVILKITEEEVDGDITYKDEIEQKFISN